MYTYQMQQAEHERTLAAMRRALRLAHEFECSKQPELAQGWGAVAANKLSQVVSQQYHVLEFRLGSAA